MPESTSSDKNAITNSAGPDENIHKDQSGQGLCHLTLTVLTSFSCNAGLTGVAVVALV